MRTITIDGEEVQINTQPSNAYKSIDIEFKPGEIIISIPRGHQIDLEKILTDHHNLIVKKYLEAASKIKLLDGDTIHIRGKPHKISIKQSPEPPQPRVQISGDTLTVHVKERENPSAVLKRWITQQTQHLIQETYKKHQKKLGTLSAKTRIQDTPRWGYCNKKGELTYNWQLATLPPDLAEYIVIHETIHLQHFHHHKRFHRNLEQIIPDHRQREKQLQRYLAIPPNFQYKKSY